MSGEKSKRPARAGLFPVGGIFKKDAHSSRGRKKSVEPKPNPPIRITSQELIPTPNLVEAREGSVFGIQRENLRRLVLDIVRRGVDQIKAEYESPKMFNRTILLTKEAMDANLQRCRYTDVQCWDETRVRLTIPPNNPNDFIHANYVRHHMLLNQFICTQGPLDSTVEDLWRLVWQERCCLILMLCQCIEVRKIKAADYWPKVAGESKNFGPFTITTTDVDNSDPKISLTRMSLQYLGEMRLVEHRQLMDWPDKSVPRIATDVLKLLAHPKSMPNNPTVVHCSAGAGRTGTLILIELSFVG
ncbi:hypothetical protein M3Y95_00627400 [Aphelenchoides besseyi]|nr:hypothetical protein M3Y95_00627400 [Aphelenchoides besseyi]